MGKIDGKGNIISSSPNYQQILKEYEELKESRDDIFIDEYESNGVIYYQIKFKIIWGK